MAGEINRWLGRAPNIAQVDVLTFDGGWEADDEVQLYFGNKSLTVRAGSTDAKTVAQNVVTAWNASTIAEFAEITAAQDGRSVTLTADTAGKPFTLRVYTSEGSASGSAAASAPGSAQEVTLATRTASSGRHHWDDPVNWSKNRLPVNGDQVIIETGDSIKYGLDQSSVALESLEIKQNWLGQIGLPLENKDGSTTYDEYRETYLKISATTVTIGQGEGNGSGRIKLDVGSNVCTMTIHNTGAPVEAGLHAIIWKGTHASNVINILKGSLDVAPFGAESATISTLRIGHLGDVIGDASVRCSSNVTLTTVDKHGGTFVADSDITTLTQVGGTTELFSGDVTTLALDGGTCYYLGTGTLTTVTVNTGATLDFTRDLRSRTITNVVNLYQRSALRDDFGTVAFTNDLKVNGAGLEDVDLRVGHDRTYAVSG